MISVKGAAGALPGARSAVDHVVLRDMVWELTSSTDGPIAPATVLAYVHARVCSARLILSVRR